MSIAIEKFNSRYQEQARKLILEGIAGYIGELDPRFNRDLDDIDTSFKSDLFLVALDDEVVIGTGGVIYNDDTPQIVRMSVRKKYRKQGIGKRILDELIAFIKEKGETRIIVETTKDWAPAVNFYLGYGFKFFKYEGDDVYFFLDLKSKGEV